MLLLILIVVAVLAFGHGGYQRGYYWRQDPYYAPRPSAGFGGGGVGLIILLVVLWLIFGHHSAYYTRY